MTPIPFIVQKGMSRPFSLDSPFHSLPVHILFPILFAYGPLRWALSAHVTVWAHATTHTTTHNNSTTHTTTTTTTTTTTRTMASHPSGATVDIVGISCHD